MAMFLALLHTLIAWVEQLDNFLPGEMLTGTKRERKWSCVYGHCACQHAAKALEWGLETGSFS
jgi:hypothetical protein